MRLALRAGVPVIVAALALTGAVPATAGTEPAATKPAATKPAATEPAATEPAATPVTPVGHSTSVTLLTGDRVVLTDRPGASPAVSVLPADIPGRHAVFTTTEVAGNGTGSGTGSGSGNGSTGSGTGTGSTGSNDIVVVPSDVAPLYGSVLDPALFNVSALARDGYDDAHADSLPLIVAHAPGARNAAGTLAAASLQPVRELTSIGATAMREPRRTAARLGAPLSAAGRAAASERSTPGQSSAPGRLAPTAGPLAGVSHIWLDGKVHTTDLDWDLGKIGAPAAWAGGSTGNGVTVAVIDTGVDATHPDLVGKVVGEANFSDSTSTADGVGHGTHVAGTIAGSGAASGGARKGVAYDADLLDVKVLGDDGTGHSSSVIAGMEWAAQHGAKVANMSLGGGPSDGQDPESQAVNALTAQYGMLFVVAAGNFPPTRYVSSPGTADAALTVGATDSNDHMAGFSAWGPRAGDAAMKPDISAPGVGIVQARAAGTSIGTPVGQYYTTLSGTSMATPHVAGAAALLAAQRPGLSAAQLKAVLQETAVTLPDTNVYIQGAGRLDVTAALAQPLIADKATFDFGRFGCTASTTSRQVTITNTGGTDATLDLGLQLTDPAGQAAAAGTATLSTTRSSIPAGKSATISVAVDPSKATAGLYSGAVVASAQGGGAPLHLPIGFMDDPNYCGIHLSAVGRDGQPAVGIAVSMDLTTGLRGRSIILIPTGGTTFFGVRGDRYSFIASVQQPLPGDRLAAALITVPELAATTETDVTLDMRRTQPASVDIPKRSTASSLVTLNAARSTPNGNSLRFSNVAGGPYGNLADYDLYGGQTADGPVKTGSLRSTLYIRQVDAAHINDPAGANTVYDLAWTGQLFPGNMRHVLNPDDVARLARVDAHYHSLGAPDDGSVDCEERLPSLDGSPLFYPCLPVRLPVQRTEYVTPGITWQRQFWHIPAADPQILQWQSVGTQTYRSAERTRETQFGGPLTTTAQGSVDPEVVQVTTSDLSDSGGNGLWNEPFTTDSQGRQLQVWRDGQQIADWPTGTGFMSWAPSGPTTWRVQRDVRLAGLLPSGVQARTVWEFHTKPVTKGSAAVPVLNASYDIPLDDYNRVKAGRPLPVSFNVHGPGGEDARTRIVAAHLGYSTDGGKTWSDLRVLGGEEGRSFALLPASALTAGRAVSLHLTARDKDGNSVDQTLIDAVPVA